MIFFFLFSFAERVDARCCLTSDSSCTGQYSPPRGSYTLNFIVDQSSSNPNHSGDPQCKNPIAPSGTTFTNIRCDFPTEANALDSIRAPLCGGSPELSNGNSVCWSCSGGGNVYCSGGSFAMAGSSPILDQHRNDGFYQLTEAEKQALGATFTFNGIEYQKPGGAIGICGSNVEACLVPGHNDCTNRALEVGSQPNPDPSLPKPTPPPPEAYNAAKKVQERLLTAKPGKREIIQGLPGNTTAQIPLKPGILTFLSEQVTINRVSRVKYDPKIAVLMPKKLRDISLKLNKFAFEYMGDLRQAQAQKYEFFEGTPTDPEKPATNKLPIDTGHRYCAPKGKIVTIDENGNRTEKDNTVLFSLDRAPNISETDPVAPFWYQQGLTGGRQATAMLCGTPQRAGTKSSNFYVSPERDICPILGIVGYVDGEPVYDVDPACLDKVLYQCNTKSEGVIASPVQSKSEGIALRDNTTGLASKFFSAATNNIVVNYFKSAFLGSLIKCNEDDEDAKCAQPTRFLQKTTGYAGALSFASFVAGVSNKDLNPEAPAEIRKKIVDNGCGTDDQRGGILATYQDIKQKKPPLTHSNITHQYILSGDDGSGVALPEEHPMWTEGVIMADECIQAQISDIKLQESGVSPKCRTEPDLVDPPISDWSLAGTDTNPISSTFTPNNTPIQEAIVAAAQQEGIPQCVLEGVGQIEGAYGWSLSDTARIAACTPNICSAAGPFQITTGTDGSGSSSCSSCPSNWVKKNGCPDSWTGNVKDACNFTIAANRAAQILKEKAAAYGYTLTNANPSSQRDAILAAGKGYYGSDAPVGRLGNVSYGQYLYNHCTGQGFQL